MGVQEVTHACGCLCISHRRMWDSGTRVWEMQNAPHTSVSVGMGVWAWREAQELTYYCKILLTNQIQVVLQVFYHILDILGVVFKGILHYTKSYYCITLGSSYLSPSFGGDLEFWSIIFIHCTLEECCNIGDWSQTFDIYLSYVLFLLYFSLSLRYELISTVRVYMDLLHYCLHKLNKLWWLIHVPCIFCRVFNSMNIIHLLHELYNKRRLFPRLYIRKNHSRPLVKPRVEGYPRSYSS